MKITKVKSNHCELVKEFSYEGSLKKSTIANMGAGDYIVQELELAGLNETLIGLGPREAIVLGSPKAGLGTTGAIGKSSNLKAGEISRTKKFFEFEDRGILLFDIDVQEAAGIEFADVLAELGKLDSGLLMAEMLIRYGSSSWIYDSVSGEQLTKNTSFHIYVVANHLKHLDDYVENLKMKSWEVGSGRFKLSRDGKALERFVFDAAVFSPERLVFEAPAVMLNGLEKNAPKSIYRSGIEIDCSRHFVMDIEQAVSRKEKALREIKPEMKLVRDGYRESRFKEGARKGLTRGVIQKQLHALEGGFINWSHLLFDMNGNEFISGDVWLNPEKYDTMQIQDPLFPEGSQKAMIYWNDGAPKIHSFKSGVFELQKMPEKELKKKVKVGKLEEQKITWKARMYKDFDGAGKPNETLDNLEVLLENNDMDFNFDMILRNSDFIHDGINPDYPNKEEAVFAMIEDFALREGLPVRITNKISALANRHAENPLRDSIAGFVMDPKRDYIQEVVDCLEHVDASVADKKLNRYMMEKWLLQAVAAWDHLDVNKYKDDTKAFELVLVLAGRQGLYKTTFFKNLLPEEFRNEYFKDGVTLNLSDKDSVMQATKKAMCELGELDGTMSKNDTAQLKAFLSNTFDEYRVPYGKVSASNRRRCVYCASVNVDSFLRDVTGSRRFLTIPIDKIDINRFLGIPKQGLWAQVWDLYLRDNAFWIDDKAFDLACGKRNQEFNAAGPAYEVMAAIEDAKSKNAPGIGIRISQAFEVLGIKSNKNDWNDLGNLLLVAGYKKLNSGAYQIPDIRASELGLRVEAAKFK